MSHSRPSCSPSLFTGVSVFAGTQIVTGIPIAQKVWEFTKFP